MAERGVIESDAWSVWSAGDRVGIVGEAGVFKIMSFRDADTDYTTVSVVGGPVWGQEQTKEWRTFAASRLTTKIVQRGKKRINEENLEEIP